MSAAAGAAHVLGTFPGPGNYGGSERNLLLSQEERSDFF